MRDYDIISFPSAYPFPSYSYVFHAVKEAFLEEFIILINLDFGTFSVPERIEPAVHPCEVHASGIAFVLCIEIAVLSLFLQLPRFPSLKPFDGVECPGCELLADPAPDDMSVEIVRFLHLLME